MKKKIGVIESVMRYHHVMFLIVGMMLLVGVYALWKMPKQEFPSFTIRQGVIVGVYPRCIVGTGGRAVDQTVGEFSLHL